jgi:8-oxo-dGTP diphosphatase/2-hydroxy-dATP diphosphatase
MKQLTLVFLIKDGMVLLAMKKRGFGAGKWNGVGGKVIENESVEGAMKREAYEEVGVIPKKFHLAAEITFDEIGEADRGVSHVSVYTCTSWDNEPIESEEMAPKWFGIDNLPLAQMWDDDKYWLPQVLVGLKLSCHFVLDNDNIVRQKEISVLNE